MVEEQEKPKAVWSFGFGSNMDVEFMKNKKLLDITDHVGAVMKGWKMMMTLKTRMTHCEPSFANACPGKETDEIHGLAFQITAESWEALKKQEGVGSGGYEVIDATFTGYDGRVIPGYMLSHKEHKDPEEEETPCS